MALVIEALVAALLVALVVAFSRPKGVRIGVVAFITAWGVFLSDMSLRLSARSVAVPND